MVYRTTVQRTPLTLRSLLLVVCLIFASIIAIITIVLVGIFGDNLNINEGQFEAQEEEIVAAVKEYPEINFQNIVDEWANSTSGEKSVLIYDLDDEKVVGSYNQDINYDTASLYKLFIVYETYRKLDSGELNINDMAGRTGKTILECVDLAIRESHSVCAEALWDMIGRDELDLTIENNFKINNSNISSLTSNPVDIMKIMKLFYLHPDIKNKELVIKMKDSFLNQPVTIYDWRQGLPSGFKEAKVYNKVGWEYNPSSHNWNTYHDAAIVEFPEQNRHFIIVVMTKNISFEHIKDLGTMIEEAFLAYSNKYY